MKRKARTRPRAAVAAAAQVIDPEDEAQTVEQVTFHPIPELLWNPDKPDEPHHSVHEIVNIRVSRAVTSSGYSYLGETTPTDLPSEKELLARFGPGRYRLDGLTTKNTFVKSRVGVCVGDFDTNPGGGVAGYRQLPPGPARPSAAENVATMVGTVIALVSPIVMPFVEHMKTEAARREERERRDADRREQMQREHTQQLMTMMQSIGTARNSDLEKMLRAALDNLSNPAPVSGAKGLQDAYVHMLDTQRAMYTDILNTEKEKAGDDETLKTLVAAFAGFTEAQKADAMARIEEVRAKEAAAAAAAAATATEAANGMAAAH